MGLAPGLVGHEVGARCPLATSVKSGLAPRRVLASREGEGFSGLLWACAAFGRQRAVFTQCPKPGQRPPSP